MKTFKYLRLFYSNVVIVVDSTDKEILDWAIASIKQAAPSCNMKTDSASGEIRLDKLQGKDLALGTWLRTQLCLNGWEPFAVTLHSNQGTSGLPTYHFRFEGDS